MKRVVGIAAMIAALLVFGATAFALEVYPQELEGGTPYEVKVVEPVNPALVGFFKSADGEGLQFAYALVEREGKYVMYVKIGNKYNGWTGARLKGDVIDFGKQLQARITYTEEGIFRTFKGQAKTRLVKID